MNLFLDLEETVMDDWSTGVLLQHKMKLMKSMMTQLEHIRGEKFNTLIIFSFAITSDSDIEHFNLHFRDLLESFFGLEISTVFKANDKNLFKLARSQGLSILPKDKPMDIFNGNMKQEAFEAYALLHHRNEFSLLFDDIVTNSHKFLFNNKNKPFEFKGSLSKNTELMTIRV